MKRLITILFTLLLTVQLSAQKRYESAKRYNSTKKYEAVKIISTYASSIVLDAMGDGLNDSNHKNWGHLCNAASVGILLTSPFIIDYDKNKWGYYLTSYVALRVALFDYTYNTTRDLPLNYIGNSSYWDKGMQKLNPPDTYMIRGVYFILGVAIPINLKKY